MKPFALPLTPCVLSQGNVQLEPLQLEHAPALEQVAQDGALWRLRVTSVPEPGQMTAYVETALKGQREGHMLPFVVRRLDDQRIVGCTRYHDIEASVRRLEIGYTWYAKSCQRSDVNTTAKLLLLTHAFQNVAANVVGWRTDNFNFASQRAIERLGAKRDGILRGHARRRDGTIRDTVMYSVTAGEWPEIKAHLIDLLNRYAR